MIRTIRLYIIILRKYELIPKATMKLRYETVLNLAK